MDNPIAARPTITRPMGSPPLELAMAGSKVGKFKGGGAVKVDNRVGSIVTINCAARVGSIVLVMTGVGVGGASTTGSNKGDNTSTRGA